MIPCTSDPCQEKTMRKMLEAAEAIKLKQRLADQLSGQFLDSSKIQGKKFGEEEKDQWPI